MISATFIFDKKQFDEEFHQLDLAIAEVARQAKGYLGEESWENTEQALMQHPKHIEAKAKQAKWLNGYQVVIAEVVRAYSNNKFFHPAQQMKP
jgi:hypothetical protein